MQNSIEMIGFCFFILHLLFMVSARHLLIFSSGIKVIDKLFEEKLAKMLFFLYLCIYLYDMRSYTLFI